MNNCYESFNKEQGIQKTKYSKTKFTLYVFFLLDCEYDARDGAAPDTNNEVEKKIELFGTPCVS